MTRKHFEYMAAVIAEHAHKDSDSRKAMMFLAEELGDRFGSKFDDGRFLARIAQYDSGERNPITYLNNH